jgi:hypothetical protein
VPASAGPTEIFFGGSEELKADSSTPTSTAESLSDYPRTSWSYSPPSSVGWSLTSRTLLTITYRSLEQGLPEYTNISFASDYIHRGLTCSSGGRDSHEHDDTGACFGAGGRCCRAYSRCLQKLGLGPRPVQIYTERFTSSDAVRTELLEGGGAVTIRGFSSCKCLRVYLRPKGKKERFPGRELPTSDVDVAEATQREYLGGTPMDDDDIINNTEPLDNLAGHEPWLKRGDGKEEEEEASAFVYGAILTFAIPHNAPDVHDSSPPPPLLWKVWMPPDPTICVETLTILDGMLDVESDGPNPSAVYLNGYQSWSYTGAVKRGHPQPASAMPHILSRAFNRGATVPPQSQKVLRKNVRGGVVCTNDEGWYDNKQDDANNDDELRSLYSSEEVDSDGAGRRTSRKRKQEDFLDEEEEEDDERHFYKSDLFACVTSQYDPSVSQQHHEVEVEHFAFTSGGPSLVLGSLSQRKQFGLITFCPDLRDVSMYCSLDGTVPNQVEGLSSDWSYAQIIPGRDRHPFHLDDPSTHYINAVAAHNGAKPMRHGVLLTGWCSWYHYYENIEESMLRQTL